MDIDNKRAYFQKKNINKVKFDLKYSGNFEKKRDLVFEKSKIE